MAPEPTINPVAVAALLTGDIPGIQWIHGDDLCDCTFQQIGFWTNPHFGATLQVRYCCLLRELAKQHPDLFRETPAFYDYNEGVFVEGTSDWVNPDADMPRAAWYRQLANRTGKTLAEVRTEYADQEPPRRLVPEAVRNTLQAALSEVRESEDTSCPS